MIPLAEVGWALTDPGAQVVVFVGGIHGDSAHHVIPPVRTGVRSRPLAPGRPPASPLPDDVERRSPDAVLLDVGLHGLDIFRSCHYTHREGEQAVVIIIES